MADEIVASEKRVAITEEERLRAGKKMVSAAFGALGEFSEDLRQDDMARRYLRALIAAEAAKNEEEKSIRGYVFDLAGHAAATAYWAWINGAKITPTNAVPHSNAAAWLLGMAQGVDIARAASRVALSLDDWEWGALDDGVGILAPMLVEQEGGAK